MIARLEEKEGQQLINEACKAYGIEEEYVFASGISAETGEAIIVTNGGKKVRYRKGDVVQKLTYTEVTGQKVRNKTEFLNRLLGTQGKELLGSPRQGAGVKYRDCDLYEECCAHAKAKGWKDFNCSNCP